MRISDWSSDVCSSDLGDHRTGTLGRLLAGLEYHQHRATPGIERRRQHLRGGNQPGHMEVVAAAVRHRYLAAVGVARGGGDRKSVGSGKSVSVRVDLGGRRILKKKTHQTTHTHM